MGKKIKSILVILLLALLAGCSAVEYRPYEGRNATIEGDGGTKLAVDGMDIWDDGAPPRRFKVLGIIHDERAAGIGAQSMMHGAVVDKAREVGGDALIQLENKTVYAGSYSGGSATLPRAGGHNIVGSSFSFPLMRITAKFMVIKYVE